MATLIRLAWKQPGYAKLSKWSCVMLTDPITELPESSISWVNAGQQAAELRLSITLRLLSIVLISLIMSGDARNLDQASSIPRSLDVTQSCEAVQTGHDSKS